MERRFCPQCNLEKKSRNPEKLSCICGSEPEPWTHQITSWGGYHAGKITCGERKIGIHFQTSDALVFFIPGPDITVAEKEAYCDSLSKKNLRYTIRRWDDFILHLKAGSWKTMPTAAAEHLLKIDLQQEEIPSPWL